MTELKSIVSIQWLADHLHHPQLVVVDCRFQLAQPHWGQQQYQQSHIPGAYYLDLNQDLSAPVGRHGGRHPLPNLEQFAQKLTKIGIVLGKTWVIAYDSSRFAFAARLWWLLRYLGHQSVALLDGGWNAWQGLHPVTSIIPAGKSGQFSPQPQGNWIVDRETVIQRKDLPEVTLIDSRESDRYRGEREPIDPLAGHIPGAVNVPWLDVTDAQGYLTPIELQKQQWANYQNSQELILYCGSGVTACVNLFSLHLAGIEDAKLYPGGWSDWCSYLL